MSTAYTAVMMDAVELTIDEIATRLASAATNELAHLKAANKCLGVVMAGWDFEPFVVTVSNYLEVKNKRKPGQFCKADIQRYAKKTNRITSSCAWRIWPPS
jgi:hypothetical protein